MIRVRRAVAATLGAAALIAGAAHAEPLVTKDQVREITVMMHNAYRYGGAAEMYEAETECWQDLAAATGDAEVVAAACGIANVAAATIEAGYAREQGRLPAMEYRADAAITRIEERMADNQFSQASIERMKTETLNPHLGSVLAALSLAGM
ncbi:hypothetical protein [Halomonas sp. OfavH-34-E]|uniref:hypothetical protein n=1 Tax=Halomonas sp. OfavH-34-E TaxID=2954491 RepID=UPI002097C6C1|nr:hypothetical protein [Halomonas sp. OfavH-34-E]MCO7216865.1 hypothetical protein [Halomonas sp. OfavH-34-E]